MTSGVGGDALEKVGEGVEAPEARVLSLQRRRCGKVGEGVAQLGDQLRDIRRVAAERARQAGGAAGVAVAAHDLHPRPVRRGAGSLAAAADEHARAARRGLPAELVCDARLADPGLAGQRHDAAASGRGLAQGAAQTPHLAFATDEDARRGRRPRGVLRGTGNDRRRAVGDRGDEAVAAPLRRLDVARLVGSVTEGAADAVEPDLENVPGHRRVRPHRIEQRFVRDDLTRVGDQMVQDGEISRAQVGALAVQPQTAVGGIELERPKGEHRCGHVVDRHGAEAPVREPPRAPYEGV